MQQVCLFASVFLVHFNTWFIRSIVVNFTGDNRNFVAIDINKFIYKSFIRKIYVITIQNFIPFCLIKFTVNFTNISIRNNPLFLVNRVIVGAIYANISNLENCR